MFQNLPHTFGHPRVARPAAPMRTRASPQQVMGHAVPVKSTRPVAYKVIPGHPGSRSGIPVTSYFVVPPRYTSPSNASTVTGSGATTPSSQPSPPGSRSNTPGPSSKPPVMRHVFNPVRQTNPPLLSHGSRPTRTAGPVRMQSNGAPAREANPSGAQQKAAPVRRQQKPVSSGASQKPKAAPAGAQRKQASVNGAYEQIFQIRTKTTDALTKLFNERNNGRSEINNEIKAQLTEMLPTTTAPGQEPSITKEQRIQLRQTIDEVANKFSNIFSSWALQQYEQVEAATRNAVFEIESQKTNLSNVDYALQQITNEKENIKNSGVNHGKKQITKMLSEWKQKNEIYEKRTRIIRLQNDMERLVTDGAIRRVQGYIDGLQYTGDIASFQRILVVKALEISATENINIGENSSCRTVMAAEKNLSPDQVTVLLRKLETCHQIVKNSVTTGVETVYQTVVAEIDREIQKSRLAEQERLRYLHRDHRIREKVAEKSSQRKTSQSSISHQQEAELVETIREIKNVLRSFDKMTKDRAVEIMIKKFTGSVDSCKRVVKTVVESFNNAFKNIAEKKGAAERLSDGYCDASSPSELTLEQRVSNQKSVLNSIRTFRSEAENRWKILLNDISANIQKQLSKQLLKDEITQRLERIKVLSGTGRGSASYVARSVLELLVTASAEAKQWLMKYIETEFNTKGVHLILGKGPNQVEEIADQIIVETATRINNTILHKPGSLDSRKPLKDVFSYAEYVEIFKRNVNDKKNYDNTTEHALTQLLEFVKDFEAGILDYYVKEAAKELQKMIDHNV